MTDPEDLNCLLDLICTIKGWNRKQLAAEAGLHRVTLSRLEHGARGLSGPTEEAIREAAGLLPGTWRELAAAIGRARREMVRGPGDGALRSRGDDPFAEVLALASARLGEALENLAGPAGEGADRGPTSSVLGSE